MSRGINPQYWMGSLNLKDAYFQVMIHRASPVPLFLYSGQVLPVQSPPLQAYDLITIVHQGLYTRNWHFEVTWNQHIPMFRRHSATSPIAMCSRVSCAADTIHPDPGRIWDTSPKVVTGTFAEHGTFRCPPMICREHYISPTRQGFEPAVLSKSF